MQVWDYIIENDSNELIVVIYTNKIHLLFYNLSLKNFTVKRIWLGVFQEKTWVKWKILISKEFWSTKILNEIW